MPMIMTKDGTKIFYKDWGPKDAQPIVFHHGWPLSSDDWDTQMLFFLANGYRVVAHDRRGHGRSSQVATGHDMDHYASDASAVVEHLDLRNAIHIGHSTGGGEVARYVAKYGEPQRPRRQGRAYRRRSPAHAQDREEPRRHSDRSVRRIPQGAGCEPGAVLSRCGFGSVLRLQPTRREGLAGNHPELVASGDDGQRTRSLRRHQGFLRDRPNGRSESDHGADSRDAG